MGSPVPDWLRRLKAAAALYSKDDDSKLAGMFHAVGAAVQLLKQTPGAGGYLEPLIALQVELDRLNNSRRARILKRRPGPIQPDGYSGMIQSVAVCIWEVLFLGLGRRRGSRGTADKQTADILNRHGVLSSQGKVITGDMVRQWRSDPNGIEPPVVAQFRAKLGPEHAREAIAIAHELAAKAAGHPH